MSAKATDRGSAVGEGQGDRAGNARLNRGGHILYSAGVPPLQGRRYAVTVLALMAAVAGAAAIAGRHGKDIHPYSPHASSSGSASNALDRLPRIMLWAWERPEDLSFIDPDEIGVAFLAKTIYLNGGRVESRPRLQPLSVPDSTALVAVVRIESGSEPSAQAPTPDQINDIAAQIAELAHQARKVSAIQIDFDARKSERDFYRALLQEVRKRLPAELPLSITALASWCIYDDWIGDLPVDEAVPMLFRMGVDDRQVRLHLEAGGEFQPRISQGSLGISTDEPLSVLPSGKRLYVFSPKKWSEEAVREIERQYGTL
jgi:hypothetical protein